MLKLGFLASNNGSSFRAIHAAIESGALDAEARLVVSNKKESGALAYAGQTLMPFDTVANAVIDVLAMSPETTCDFMELRPTL